MWSLLSFWSEPSGVPGPPWWYEDGHWTVSACREISSLGEKWNLNCIQATSCYSSPGLQKQASPGLGTGMARSQMRETNLEKLIHASQEEENVR